MKKKLLLILTTILLAVTTFTSNVFADYTTAGEVFASTSTSYKSWTDKNGQTFGDLVTDDIESENVSKNAANDYTFSWSSKDFYLLMEGDILKSIVVYDSNPAPDGTYLSTYRDPNVISIGSILPDDFPIDVTSGWSNGLNNIYVVHESDGIKVYGANHLNLYDEVTPEGSNYYVTYLGGKITFVMSGSKFSKITISGFPAPYADLNGDYVPQIHISDILPADFPTTRTNGFVNENGERAFISGSTLKFGASNNPGLVNPLTSVGDDYTYTDPYSVTFFFKMSNGVLDYIQVDGSSNPADDGKYEKYGFQHDPIVKPIGYNGEITFITNGKYTPGETNVIINIDNNLAGLGEENYRIEHGVGFTKFILLGSYVQTLEDENHNIKINVLSTYPSINQDFFFRDIPSPGGGGGSSSSGHVVLNTGVSSLTSK